MPPSTSALPASCTPLTGSPSSQYASASVDTGPIIAQTVVPVLDDDDVDFLRTMITAHVDATDSAVGQRILADWDNQLGYFTKVMPRDYKRVLQAIADAQRNGDDVNEAIMAAARG